MNPVGVVPNVIGHVRFVTAGASDCGSSSRLTEIVIVYLLYLFR